MLITARLSVECFRWTHLLTFLSRLMKLSVLVLMMLVLPRIGNRLGAVCSVMCVCLSVVLQVICRLCMLVLVRCAYLLVKVRTMERTAFLCGLVTVLCVVCELVVVVEVSVLVSMCWVPLMRLSIFRRNRVTTVFEPLCVLLTVLSVVCWSRLLVRFRWLVPMIRSIEFSANVRPALALLLGIGKMPTWPTLLWCVTMCRTLVTSVC